MNSNCFNKISLDMIIFLTSLLILKMTWLNKREKNFWLKFSNPKWLIEKILLHVFLFIIIIWYMKISLNLIRIWQLRIIVTKLIIFCNWHWIWLMKYSLIKKTVRIYLLIKLLSRLLINEFKVVLVKKFSLKHFFKKNWLN